MLKTARANWTLADAKYRRSKVARPFNQGSIKAMIECARRFNTHQVMAVEAAC
jgi:hypothetical protein